MLPSFSGQLALEVTLSALTMVKQVGCCSLQQASNGQQQRVTGFFQTKF